MTMTGLKNAAAVLLPPTAPSASDTACATSPRKKPLLTQISIAMSSGT